MITYYYFQLNSIVGTYLNVGVRRGDNVPSVVAPQLQCGAYAQWRPVALMVNGRRQVYRTIPLFYYGFITLCNRWLRISSSPGRAPIRRVRQIRRHETEHRCKTDGTITTTEK